MSSSLTVKSLVSLAEGKATFEAPVVVVELLLFDFLCFVFDLCCLGGFGVGTYSFPFFTAHSISMILYREKNPGPTQRRKRLCYHHRIIQEAGGGEKNTNVRHLSLGASTMGRLDEEDVNDEKYPPFFELHVVGYIALGLAVQLECDVQVAPSGMSELDVCETMKELRAYFSECARASATYARPVFFLETGERRSASCVSLFPCSLREHSQ